MLGDVNKLFLFKRLLTTPSNDLPLHLKQPFPPIIWIFTEGEGDGIESRLPFKIFTTLLNLNFYNKELLINFHFILNFWKTVWMLKNDRILFKNRILEKCYFYACKCELRNCQKNGWKTDAQNIPHHQECVSPKYE